MRRDPTKFRERFNRWKNGELVYESGLPKFEMGKSEDEINTIDKTVGMDYVRHIENSDSIGWNKDTKRWTKVNRKGFDSNAIGIGLDLREPDIVAFMQEKGRTANPYLTEMEERLLRVNKYTQKKAVVDRFYKKNYIKGNTKDAAIMTGMAYQGHPMKMLNTPGSITRNAVQADIDAKKPIGEKAFEFYYNYDTNKTRYADRYAKHKSYVWPKYNDGKESEDPIVYDTYMPEIVVTPNEPLHFSGHTYSEAWNLDTKDKLFILNIYAARKPWIKPLAALTMAPAAITLAPALSTVISNPYVQTAFAADAAYRQGFTDEGIRKTARLINEGNYNDAVFSGLGDVLDLTMMAPMLYKGTKGAYDLSKQGWNWANRNYVQPYRLYNEIGKTSPVLEELNPTVRTKLGDVEIDNPNLFYRQDNPSLGAFDHANSYVQDGMVIPGLSRIEGQNNYSWWNKGKPYLHVSVDHPVGGVSGKPIPRLFTAADSDGSFLRVRDLDYSIGQWNGKRGFILQSEYVSPEAVNVSNSTYIYEPNYGYKKVTTEPSVSTIDFNTARTKKK